MLKVLLFLPLLLFANEDFLLPDESHYFLYSLNEAIQDANDSVYIFTESIDDYELMRSLKQSAKGGKYIMVIAQNTPKKLSIYNNIDLYTLQGDVDGSYICIDDRTSYTLSLPLDYESLRNKYAYIRKLQGSCQSIFTTLLQRSTKY